MGDRDNNVCDCEKVNLCNLVPATDLYYCIQIPYRLFESYVHHVAAVKLVRCNEKLTVAHRENIFHNFWQMADHTRQRDFIRAHVTVKQKYRNKTEKSRRQKTYHYFLSVNETKVKVCKAVFLSTLNIGEKMVSYTLNHAITNTGQASGDRRGRHPQALRKRQQCWRFLNAR